MAWQIRLDFNDGVGWVDIADYVRIVSVRATKQLYNDLQPSVNSCSFEMSIRDQESRDFLGKLLTFSNKTNLKVNIKDDNGDDYFTGYIRKNFEARSSIIVDPVKIECVDPGFLLKKKIDYDIAWQNYKILDPSNTSQSIIHQLMVKAGFSVSDVATATINKTIDYFLVTAEDDKQYWEVLSKLLFDFHYVFYFDNSGKLAVFDWDVRSTSTSNKFESYVSSGDEGNMLSEIRIKKSQEKYLGAEVSWWGHETLTNTIVFSDTQGGDGTANNKCSIDVQPNNYFPGATQDPTETEWKLKYGIDKRIIVLVTTATPDVDKASALVVHDAFENHYSYAKYSLYNTDNLIAAHISRFDVKGTAIVKSIEEYRSKTVLSEGDQEIYKYVTSYVTTKADGDALSEALARFYKFGDFEFEIVSNSDYDVFEIGDIVRIVDHVTTVGTSVNPADWVYALVTETKDSWHVRDPDSPNWILRRVHTLVGVSEYSASVVSSSVISSPPPQIPLGFLADSPAAADLTDYAKYENIQEGYDLGGGTTTPTKPIAAAYAVGTKAIKITWDRQLDLTNLDHYEVQVSSDNINWYSLYDGGTDWKETLDAVTEIAIEQYVHAAIPNSGSALEPSGTTLYYRVRRTTKSSVNSDWSDAVSATTNIVVNGDLAANVVNANQVVTGTLQALIAQINDLLTIGSDGYVGQTGAADGDQYAKLDQNEVGIYYIRNGVPEVVCKLGGDENGGFFPYAQLRGIAKPGAAQEFDTLGIGDMIPDYSHLYDFENNLYDQYDVSPWTASNQEFTTGKYGTYGLRSTAASTMSLVDSDAAGCVWSTGMGLDFWLNNVSFNTSLEEIVAFESAKQVELKDKDAMFSMLPGPAIEDQYAHYQHSVMVDSTHSVSMYIRQTVTHGSYDTTLYEIMCCPVKLNSDGTQTVGSEVIGYYKSYRTSGSPANYGYVLCNGAITRLTNTSFVISWSEYDGYGNYYHYAKVGTLSGDSISVDAYYYELYTYGAATAYPLENRIDRLDDSHFLALYTNYTGNIDAVVGTVSGTTIVAGSSYSISSTAGGASSPEHIRGLVCLSSSLAILAYTTSATPHYLRTIAISISGNVVSGKGSIYTVSSTNNSDLYASLESISSTKAVVIWKDDTASKIYGAVLSVSGTTITAGTSAELVSDSSIYPRNAVYFMDFSSYPWLGLLWYKDQLYSKSFYVNGTSIVVGTQNTIGYYSLGSYSEKSWIARFPGSTGGIRSIYNPQEINRTVVSYYIAFTYTKLSAYVGAYDGYDIVRFTLYNLGYSETTTNVDTSTLTAGFRHFSMSYDVSNKLLRFTESANTLGTISTSDKVLSGSANSLTLKSYSQRQVFDDLLYRPSLYLPISDSLAHAASGQPWSWLVDYDTDLLLIPMPGGDVVVAGKIRGLYSTWTAPSFTNSWADYASGYDPAAYRLNADGDVELRGVICTGTGSAFTLPVGYRPQYAMVFVVDNNGAYATVVIQSSGTVTPSSNTRISLAGIKFSPA